MIRDVVCLPIKLALVIFVFYLHVFCAHPSLLPISYINWKQDLTIKQQKERYLFIAWINILRGVTSREQNSVIVT